MIRYDGELIPKAKNLRKNSTPQENKLWYEFLRKYPVRFQRQKTIDRYIVDFYCSKAKIAIEIDGSQHFEDENKKYDEDRTERLGRYGIKVLRFSNYDINKYFYDVCSKIDNEVKTRL